MIQHAIRALSLLSLSAALCVAGLIAFATWAAACSLDIGPLGLLTLPLPFGFVPLMGFLTLGLACRNSLQEGGAL